MDPSKWSAGHVPTASEDVSIAVAGTYTVSLPLGSGEQDVKSVTVGGASGAQTLKLDDNLTVAAASSVGAMGNLVVDGNGSFYASTPVADNGKITLSGGSNGQAYVRIAASITGIGQIVFSGDDTSGGGGNDFNGGLGGTIAAGITIHGKGGYIASYTINGAVKSEVAGNTITLDTCKNNGSIAATGGASLRLLATTNNAGKTISITGGGTLDLDGGWVNNGNISSTNSTVNLGGTFSGTGPVTRTGGAVNFTGTYDLANHPLAFNPSTGAWNWQGGILKNISSLTFTGAGGLTQAAGQFGVFDHVTLASDLTINGGFSLYVNGGLTLAGSARTITLAGSPSAGIAAMDLSSPVGGAGTLLFAGADTAGGAFNFIDGSYGASSLGGGITVRGSNGTVNKLINSGIILADTAGKTISVIAVSNKGGIIAAPGTIRFGVNNVNSTGGSFTVGIGGTAAGTSYGVFDWGTKPAALAQTFNTVLLNGYIAPVAAAFTVAKFASKSGAFAVTNLEAGYGRKFSAAIGAASIKVTAAASTLAYTSVAAHVLTINGTALADTISVADTSDVLYAKMATSTVVFFSPPLTGVVVNGNAGADKITFTTSIRGGKIFGGAGNDTLTGGGGSDVIDGGADNDSILGNAGNDTITGGDGNDIIDGGAGSDLIHGNAGLDKITGGADPDQLFGDDGVDTFYAADSGTKDSIDGGAGNDIIGSKDLVDVLVSVP